MSHSTNNQLSFGQIGQLYNTLADQLVGGVTPGNQQTLLKEVSTIQTQIQGLVNANSFTGATLVHAQNVADQLNFLTKEINDFGVDSLGSPAPKFINDVVRDIQDIVQGDPTLAALSHQNNHSGFQQISNLLVPPTPFNDSPAQQTTLLQFITDSNSLATRALAVAAGGTDANLVADIHTFSVNADAYSTAQGGVFSARFNNEFTLNGVQGTASRELITGLETGNTTLIQGAAEVLQANAADVRQNMFVTGDPAHPPGNGIPAFIDTVNEAGVVFNDAVTKLVGGVSVTNQASLLTDLNAVSTGLANTVTDQHLTGRAATDVAKVQTVLADEIVKITSISTAVPTQVSSINGNIHADTIKILNIINNDTTLSTMAVADGTTGFIALPKGDSFRFNFSSAPMVADSTQPTHSMESPASHHDIAQMVPNVDSGAFPVEDHSSHHFFAHHDHLA
jgi:hypothetical protein